MGLRPVDARVDGEIEGRVFLFWGLWEAGRWCWQGGGGDVWKWGGGAYLGVHEGIEAGGVDFFSLEQLA